MGSGGLWRRLGEGHLSPCLVWGRWGFAPLLNYDVKLYTVAHFDCYQDLTSWGQSVVRGIQFCANLWLALEAIGRGGVWTPNLPWPRPCLKSLTTLCLRLQVETSSMVHANKTKFQASYKLSCKSLTIIHLNWRVRNHGRFSPFSPNCGYSTIRTQSVKQCVLHNQKLTTWPNIMSYTKTNENTL